MNSWKAFSASAGCGGVLPAKNCRHMTTWSVVSWQEVRWIWPMRQNFVVQFVQLFQHWLCDEQLDIVMEKNWAYSVDRCQRLALQFSVHRISLLNILLRCNGFTRIRPASDHQTVTMTFFSCKFGFGKYFGASQFNHWAGHRQLSYKIHFSSHVTVREMVCFVAYTREDNTSKMTFFLLFFGQLMRHPLIKLFHLSNMLQMLNDLEWSMLSSRTTSCVVVRGSASMIAFSWFSTSDGQPLHSSSSSSRLLCKTSRTTTALYVHQQFLGQMCCWCCKLYPLLYDPFWTQIKNFFEFSVCLTSIISVV